MDVPFDTDSAWLRAAMKLPVTASLGPMGPVLQQLHSLVASGRSLPEGVSTNDILLLDKGLKGLCVSLKDLSEEDHEPSFTAKCWIKEVREICYDVEDNLDEAMHSGARESERPGIISWIRSSLEKRYPRFSELLARVEDASEIRLRLQLDLKTIRSDFGQSGVSHLTPQLSLQLIEDHMNKLVELLAFDDEDKMLLVVAIFGGAGVGKTTLVRSLYHRFRGEFQCRAFLRVSRDPDMRRLLTSMLSQIKAPPANPFSDVQHLIESIRKHLKGKRCLIVIDDLWASSTFDIISCTFPDVDCRSRIITTTQIEDVALACRSYHSGYILKMGSLDDDKSGELLLSRVCYSESSCMDPTSKEIKEVYDNLPTHLKTCLLYLNMYPEGYTISKDDLVKQWVAEGFLSDVERQDAEEIAGGYFDELVSRGMIQPVDTGHNDEVLSCTICCTVLDLIRYKCIEENFITVVGHFQTALGLLDKVRRLSVQFGDAKCATLPAGFRISQVRSLIFFGFLNCVPSIVDYRLLRVLILHIWADQDKIFDLTVIGELIRLRYLKIECNTTVHLPHRIQMLQYLETLEVDATVADIPSDIDQLKNLLHLRLPSENVLNLVNLTKLRDLHLTCSTAQLNHLVDNIGSILWKFNDLQSLSLDAGPSSMSISCDGLSSVSPVPSHLERIDLLPRICIFSSLPKWLQKLDKLCVLKIAVRKLSRKDIHILKELPALASLSLYVGTAPVGWIILDDQGFPVLKYFKFMCIAPYLSFVEGAMPNVRKVKLAFNANRMKSYSFATFGFQHLTCLREISVNIGGAGVDESDRKAAESALKAAVSNHSNSPIIRVQCVYMIFYGEGSWSTATEEGKHWTPGKQHEIQEEGISDAISGNTTRLSYGEGDKSTTAENEEHSSLEKTRQHKKNNLGHSEKKNKEVDSRYVRADRLSIPVGHYTQSVDVTTVAIGSLLPRLAELLNEKYELQMGVRKDVECLHVELASIHSFLINLGEVPHDQVISWADNAREFTFKIEDVVDNFLVRVKGFEPAANVNKFKGLKKEVARLFKKDKSRHEFANAIKDMKDQVLEVAARHYRYKLHDLSSARTATTDPRDLSALYNKAINLVGIDEPRDELIKRLLQNDGLEILSIVGFGGLGKTTLAKAIYDSLEALFDCRALVSVSQNGNITRILKTMLHQFDHSRYAKINEMLCGTDELIHEVRNFLSNKRYLIVLDDIWDSQLWNTIRYAFVQNDCQSIVIMTTRDFDIAIEAGSYYKLNPLTLERSKILFYGRIFGFGEKCPEQLVEVSLKILKKCGGIPLAIITMASLLGTSSKMVNPQEWEEVSKSIGYGLGNSPQVKDMRKIFSLSYYNLPLYLRTCLLYLSIYPEDYEIPRDDLIWKLIAEGFVQRENPRGFLFETVDRYLHELITRDMIQPCVDYKGNVTSYRLHGMVLDIIRYISSEENFITILDDTDDTTLPLRNVHWLSLQNGKEDRQTASLIVMSMSQVRSITIFPPAINLMPPDLCSFDVLRVLDLSRCFLGASNNILTLRHVGNLFHLRYLGLADTNIRELPMEIGKLQFLQVLDLRNNSDLEELPFTVCNLKRLMCFHVNGRCQRFPDGLGSLTCMEVLKNIPASLNIVKELRNLARLRELEIKFGLNVSMELGDAFVESLCSLKDIQSLVIHGRFPSMDLLGERWVPPQCIRKFDSQHLEKFSTLPAWINRDPFLLSYLSELCICVKELQQEDLLILGSLPSLCSLSIRIDHHSPRLLLISTDGFRRMISFSMFCLSPGQIVFQQGALPRVERVSLACLVIVRDLGSVGFNLGLRNLLSLRHVSVTICCPGVTVGKAYEAEAALGRTLDDHPNHPTSEILIRPVIP